MEFRNFTPFPALAFQALDVAGRHHHVVVMRQTLLIEPDGALKYADTQEPLAVADDYFGEINKSSVRQESDLAPFKPRCDVIVVAAAYAPGGTPASRFEVSLRMTSASDEGTILDKALIVTGRRSWRKAGIFRHWKLSDPEPIASLPIRYEFAYGGEQKLDDDSSLDPTASADEPPATPPSRHSVIEANPVGMGYSEEWFRKAKALDRIPAPQLEDPRCPVTTFGERYAPQGFGVITKAWLPRRERAGTADDAFAKSDRWLPEDFDFAFWNGAHPDMQVPYLRGDEALELTNLTPEGTLRFALPGHRPYALVRYQDGDIQPAAINLDTLIVDCERKSVGLVHRLVLPVEPDVRVLDARLITRSDWDAAVAHSQRASNGQPDATAVLNV